MRRASELEEVTNQLSGVCISGKIAIMNISDALNEKLHRKDKLDLSVIQSWINEGDFRLKHEVFELLHEHELRTEPPIRLDDFFEPLLDHCKYCIVHNPDPKEEQYNFFAQAMMNHLFCDVWADEWGSRLLHEKNYYLAKIKSTLKDIYRENNSREIRDYVEMSLSHLVMYRDIADYFSDWKYDAVMKDAYSNELKNADGHACAHGVKTKDSWPKFKDSR